MTLAVLCALTVLAVTTAALVWDRRRLPQRHRRVLISFRHPDTSAVRGVLLERRGAWLVLTGAELLDGVTKTPAKVDGLLTIDVACVLFIQVLP